ncbi:unnamed protein product [Linum trigynum]|uniref:TIR domain-containing protein n=1 Tax=Linum trigynum TaxID=586398 RepID=A0AAV2F3E2_9ROSI
MKKAAGGQASASLKEPSSPSPSDPKQQQFLPVGEYEVFLSFRGPDIRDSFADCVYRGLIRSKIRTFRDEQDLPKGEKMEHFLLRAIVETKIYVPIISPTYVDSRWCLQELAKMVECWKQGKGHVILPIFYFVAPSEVKKQESAGFKSAFELYGEKFDAATIGEWKEALKEVGEMKGWHVTELVGQGTVINEVFVQIECHLRNSYKLATDELVGINSHVENMKKLLNHADSNTQKIVGIHGMSGTGKTTIAKAVYNEVCVQFDQSCFLEDVRRILSSENGGDVTLQTNIISSILKVDSQVRNVGEGINIIRDRVCRHKVLIVLDDVDERFDFDRVFGRLDYFSTESRFIITTTDKRVLIKFDHKLYEPEEMSHEYSLVLFSKHAFGADHPPAEFLDTSEKFVEAASRLPIALKVIGSLLFRRDMKFWDAKLTELRSMHPTKVQERLRINYNELTYYEKQIFLDIACFFVGEDKEIPFYMWDGSGYNPEGGIDSLLMKSLIKINERNQFWMHDHFRRLGEHIVQEDYPQQPFKRSRIWSNEDALEILRSGGKGSNYYRVEALRIDMRHMIEDQDGVVPLMKKLPGLRYLEVAYGRLVGDLKEALPKLRCLRLRHCSSVPASFSMEELTVLELRGSAVKDDWQGWNRLLLKGARQLKVVDLSSCRDLETPPDLSRCPSMQVLNLSHCSAMKGKLPISKLTELRQLNISRTKISELSGGDNLTTKLQKLQTINALDSALTSLPTDLQHLNSLKTLEWTTNSRNAINVDYNKLLFLPAGLTRLTLSRTVVANLSDLEDLEELRFEHCPRENSILEDIARLLKLKILMLRFSDDNHGSNWDDRRANTLLALPPSLTRLHVRHYMHRENYFPSLVGLTRLTELYLIQVGFLEIPSLNQLVALETLRIFEAPNLVNLDGLEGLEHLMYLTVENCGALKTIPSLRASSTKLQKLVIRRCPRLTEIQEFVKLKRSLPSQLIRIRECPSLVIVDEEGSSLGQDSARTSFISTAG